MLSIGLIADTHGILDPLVCPAFAAAKVSHILHAGDIADGTAKNRLDAPSLLAALADGAGAPVSAVRGNADDKSNSGHGLPQTLTYQAGAVRFVVHHGDEPALGGLIQAKNDGSTDDAVLEALRPADGWRSDGSDIIVSGHSHKARFERHARSGVYFLNPGTRLRPSAALVVTTIGSRSVEQLGGRSAWM